jgi:putative transposase
VKNLVKNHHLAKSIQDASWSLFTKWLDYYGKIWDKVVVAVPPHYTTQDCSNCGHRVQKTLSTRTHQCPVCLFVGDRDRNAALNILKKGLEMLGIIWNNGTYGCATQAIGHKGTAPQGGTLGERCTSAVEGNPETVSALVEPRTRISCLVR